MSEVLKFVKPDYKLSDIDKQFLELEGQKRQIEEQARLIRSKDG